MVRVNITETDQTRCRDHMDLVRVNGVLLAALIMLTGENIRPAISIWFVFVPLFPKFYENDNIQKLKASSFRL